MSVGIQTDVMRARGHSYVRGGVVNSLVGGTIRVMQAWDANNLTSFHTVYSQHTVLDALTGFNVLDFSVRINREFVLVRFIGDADFTPGVNDTFEFQALVIPAALS